MESIYLLDICSICGKSYQREFFVNGQYFDEADITNSCSNECYMKAN